MKHPQLTTNELQKSCTFLHRNLTRFGVNVTTNGLQKSCTFFDLKFSEGLDAESKKKMTAKPNTLTFGNLMERWVSLAGSPASVSRAQLAPTRKS